MFDPTLVVSQLVKEFGSCDIVRSLFRKERRIAESFTSILRDALYDNLVIDCEEDNFVEDDHTDPLWSPDDGDEESSLGARRPATVTFGDVEVPIEKVNEAIAFYRSSAKKSRTFSCMKSRFRFIATEYHLRKLRKLATESEIREDRSARLRSLAEKLNEEVIAKMNMGISLHDHDIRQMALKLNKESPCPFTPRNPPCRLWWTTEGWRTYYDGIRSRDPNNVQINKIKENSLVDNFKASHKWIQGFKSNCGIVSRRITTFTSRKGFLDKDRISADAQSFVLEVKKGMENWSLGTICNADQSGFVKELHSARTLAIKGQKKVERVVQSVSALTHSFTVMPTLFADGHLAKKLYVVMQEPNGRFPAKGFFRAPNLEVRASTSHMMTKELMLDWVNCCIGSTDSPKSTLLIVDSWSSFKDHAAMQSALPAGKTVKILNIPPGATSMIQPLDVYFFSAL